MFSVALFMCSTTVNFAQNAPATTSQTVKTTAPKKAKKVKKAATSTAKVMYECPMKCEAPTDKAGKCGKCGMDLKVKKA